MSLFRHHQADRSIEEISRSLKEVQAMNEEAEDLRAHRREVFDAVSDAVWIFQEGRCRLRNRAAEDIESRVTDEAGTLRKQVLASGLKREYGFPGRLQLTSATGGPLVLDVQRTTRLELESGPGIQVMAADLSLGFEMAEKLNKRKFQEQRRIARDLHDGLTQLLASLAYQLQALSLREGEAEMDRLAALAEQALGDAATLHRRYADTSNLREIP